MHVRTDRHQAVDAAPSDLWPLLASVDRYRAWWPWLHSIDADALAAGQVWRCAVRPPVPYVVRFRLHLTDVEPPTRVAATLDGDITGSASLHVTAAPAGADLHFVADLEPSAAWLRALSTVAATLARFGHDRVVDHGLSRLAEVVETELSPPA